MSSKAQARPVETLELLKGTLRGRFLLDAGASGASGVEVLVDGAVTARLMFADDENEGVLTYEPDGSCLLSWFVPSRYYDGTPHSYEIRLIGADERVLGAAVDQVLLPKKAPVLFAEVRVADDGGLLGYASESRRPNAHLKIDAWVNGRREEQVVCAARTPAFAPADTPRGCGFSISPSKVGPWLAGKVRLVVRELEVELPFPRDGLLALMELENIASGRDPAVTIHRPAGFRDLKFDVLVDGERVAAREFHRLADVVELHLERPARKDEAVHELSVRVAGTDAELPGSPRKFRWDYPPQLLANPEFLTWNAGAPEGWCIPDPDVVTARPSVEGPGIVLNARITGERLVLLRQELPVSDRETEVRSRLRANRPCSLDFALAGPEGPAGEPASISLDEGWQDTQVRLPPTGVTTGPLSLEISLKAGEAVELEAAFIMAGRPGFAAPERLAPRRKVTRGWTAVRNGDFSSWPRGFEVVGMGDLQEVATGWYIRSRKPLQEVVARLTQIRDVHGRQAVYGLELSGDGQGVPLTLFTELDKAKLAKNEVDRFEAVLSNTGGAESAPSRIQRITLIHRVSSLSDGGVKDTLIGVVAHNVHLTASVQHRSFELGSAERANLKTAALAALASPSEQIVLVFEFQDYHLDVQIGQVFLGCPKTVRQPTRTGYAGFEDYNLLSQVRRLSGANEWRSPAPVRQRVQQAEPRTPDPVNPEPVPEAAGRWNWTAATPSVDILVPVHNAGSETIACLQSLSRFTTIPHHVIIVDDFSSPSVAGSLDDFIALRPWMRLIRNPKNLGYTRSANVALRASTAEWVILLNSDTEVTPYWVEGLLECAERRDGAAMVGPLSNAATWQSVPDVKSPQGGWMVNRLPPGVSVETFAELVRSCSKRAFPEVPLLNGFCTLMRRAVIEELGYLDEVAFPVGYGEENDLCVRVARAGHKLAIADHVYVHHQKSASFGSAGRADLAKKGSLACRAKHPEVNFEQLQQVLAECIPLLELRKSLKERLGVPVQPQ